MNHPVLSFRSSLTVSFFGFALLAAAAPGCASAPSEEGGGSKKKDIYTEEKEPVLVNEAVNVDQKFSDDVVVGPEVGTGDNATKDLTIVTAGHESMLAKIKVGSIIAGDRSSKPIPEGTAAEDGSVTGDYGPNPYGFLRKVIDIKTDGANTILKTAPARLDEWLQDGDIDWSSRKSLLDGSVKIADPETTDANGKTVTTKSLHILSDDQQANSSGSGQIAVNASLGAGGAGVKLSNAQIKLGVKYDGYIKVRYKELRFLPDPPTGVAFKSLLTMDPEVSADLEFKVSGMGTLFEKEWNTRGIVIPLPGPVPTTLRLEPTIKCSLSAGGEVAVTVNAKIGAHGATGFQGDARIVGGIDLDDISEAFKPNGSLTLKSASGKVALQGSCRILAKPILLAFDAIGVQGKIGPYMSISANACVGVGSGGANPGLTITEEHGLSGEFGGRIQVPVIGVGKDFKGLGIEIPFGPERYIYGTEKSCEAPEKPSQDSCQGKSDGFHCSEVYSYGGIVCKGGQIEKGVQCDSVDKKCSGGTADTINCN